MGRTAICLQAAVLQHTPPDCPPSLATGSTAWCPALTHTHTHKVHPQRRSAQCHTEYAIAALHLEMDRVLGFAHLVHMAVHARTTVAKVDPLWVPLCTGAVGEVVWGGQKPARIQTLLSVACKGYCCLLVLGCCRMYCCMLARETSSSLFTQLQHEHTNTVSPRKACAGHCETK